LAKFRLVSSDKSLVAGQRLAIYGVAQNLDQTNLSNSQFGQDRPGEDRQAILFTQLYELSKAI
jgi:hypothetical protein